jgi:hypothetical protein
LRMVEKINELIVKEEERIKNRKWGENKKFKILPKNILVSFIIFQNFRE